MNALYAFLCGLALGGAFVGWMIVRFWPPTVHVTFEPEEDLFSFDPDGDDS